MRTSSRAARIIKTLALAALAVLALVWGVWLVAIPGSLITGKADAELRKAGLRAEYNRFGKGIFYSVGAEGVRLVRTPEETGLLFLDELRVALRPASVIRFSPVIDFSAGLSGGSLTGSAGTGGDVHAEARGVELSGLGLEEMLPGLRAGGRADMSLDMTGATGQVKFSVDDMRFGPYTYMAISVPLDLFKKARGLVRLERGMAVMESVSFEGEGIYARVKGSVGKGAVDLTLELMPSEQVENSLPYFGLLRRFQASPGHYSIPIKRSL